MGKKLGVDPSTSAARLAVFRDVKRSLLAILGLALLLTVTATVARADFYGEFTYSVTNNEVTITGCSDRGGAVTIPSTIPGVGTVKYIGDDAFFGCTHMTSLSIPDGVTTIGDRAFLNCVRMSSVTIPDSVTSIKGSAFFWCTSLTNIVIPKSVTSIGDYGFYGCDRLAKVTLSDSVASIGNLTFNSCPSLTAIEVDTNNSSYSSLNGVLFDKNQTTLVQYPGGLAGAYAIPSGVTSIGLCAFADCPGLTSVTIPISVTSIGNSAFNRCTRLIAIDVDPNNANYSSLNGVLFDKSQSTLVQYPGGLAGAYVIPDTVTSIWRSAFAYCGSLTYITIPDSVRSITNSAFLGCSRLTGITISTGVTSIGDHAFESCARLTIVTLPDSVTSIGDYAFYLCNGLTSVNIPSSVTSIADHAFESCTNLTLVTIPESVTSIGNYAFHGCNSLASVSIPKSVKFIGQYALANCSSLTSVTFPNGVTSIGDYAFASCTGVTNVGFPSSVTSIGDCAFASCTNLTSLTIPSSVTLIGDRAFFGCKRLTSAFFEGYAPPTFGVVPFGSPINDSWLYGSAAPGFTIYYPLTGSGWSTLTWNGYAAKPYNLLPLDERPIVSLVVGSGTAAPVFTRLQAGSIYQLQVSSDLANWSNSGAVFAATNVSQACSQSFDMTNASRLYFRLEGK